MPIVSGDDIPTTLANFWKDTFTATPFDEPAIDSFLDKHARQLEICGSRPPTPESFRKVLSNMPSSSPGPDGIPCAAWASGGPAAVRTLWKCTLGRLGASLCRW